MDGTRSTTDLVLSGSLLPSTTYGVFNLSDVSLRSHKTPFLQFTRHAREQLNTLFWESTAFGVTQGAYKMVVKKEPGGARRLSVITSPVNTVEIESVPVHQYQEFGSVLIRELHLFTDKDGVVEVVNAKFIHPGREAAYKIHELELEPSYLPYWSNGKMRNFLLDLDGGSSEKFSCVPLIAAAAGAATAYFLFFF